MSEVFKTIKGLVDNDRLLQTLQEQVLNSKYYDKNLYNTIVNYTDDYLKIEFLKNFHPEKIYFNFIRAYNKDMKALLSLENIRFQ